MPDTPTPASGLLLITDLDYVIARAVLATKPTVESVAVVYAICMSQGKGRQGPEFWRPFHEDICAALWPGERLTDSATIKKLDRVKTRAWKLYEAMVAVVKESAT